MTRITPKCFRVIGVIRGYDLIFFAEPESNQYNTNPKEKVTNQAYVYSVSRNPGTATCPPGVVAARINPGTTGATAITSVTIARQLMPLE